MTGAQPGPAGADRRADVIVVGAGPAGASAARHLAAAGRDVLLLERAAFPRDKVCGDGLTPRAVHELAQLDLPTGADDGWARTKGLRLVAGGRAHEIAWPDSATWPSYGLVRTRADFDEVLARHAVAAGARLVERTSVTGPLRQADGRVVGVVARGVDDAGRRTGDDVVYRAPVVLAADGVSSRLATALGIARRPDRPLGVAARAYYRTPRSAEPWMESWLELWSGAPRRSPLLPGYGWIFGLGDGTANVGLGVIDAGTSVDVRAVLAAWLATTPGEWTLDADHQVGPVRSAALPMGFNRTPHVRDGVLLLGDAGGMVNPFTGEGIEYALLSGRLAARAVGAALAAPDAQRHQDALAGYSQALRSELGSYFTLGRGFARLIAHPAVMAAAVRFGLPRRSVMRVVVALMANVAEPAGSASSAWPDQIVRLLTALAPAG